jgi:hypothetical protein
VKTCQNEMSKKCIELEKISNRKMALQIERNRNRENKEQLISFVFGFNLPVTIFYILHYNKWFKTNCKL